MKKLQPAIAPHKSLPPEMLVEIFLHYAADIAEQVINEEPMYRCLSQFPWVLGHICSKWRQIALGEPRIWGTIGLHAVEQGDRPMLNEAFRRGVKSPLWLSASEDEHEESVHDDFLRDVVCSQSKRLTELSLFVFWEAFEEFLTLPQDTFPVLEAVQLAVLDCIGVNGANLCMSGSDLSVFRGAACLRRIDIGTPRLEVTPLCFPMNLGLCWPQVTHINFLRISIKVSIAHELMNLCTSLHECCLSLIPVLLDVAFRPASIRLSHLRNLVVQEDGPNRAIFSDFILPLVLPALEDFQFSLWQRSLADLAPLAGLVGVIDGWSTSRVLALRAEMNYWGKHLAEVAGHLSFLTSIDALHSILPASGIQMMAQEQYLPRLLSLRASVAFANMDDFIDMLKTRWARTIVRQGSQLQSGTSACMIRSGTIFVLGADDEFISRLSNKIREVQEEIGVSGIHIDLRACR